MFVIREVLNCKPGKVMQMIEKFTVISGVIREMGHDTRLLTDVTGEPFWTIVAEITVENIDDFFAIERQLMANDGIRQTMTGYHDLVGSGRREIYRVQG
jgi:hypothetical protein